MRLRTAVSGQRGQSSAEYIAALLLVAAIIAVVVASPVGGQVRAVVGDLSCTLLADGAPGWGGGPEQQAVRPPPLKPCKVDETADSEQVQADVAFVRVGVEDQAVFTERSNGSAAVMFVDRGEVGGVLRTPPGIDRDRHSHGDRSRTARASASEARAGAFGAGQGARQGLGGGERGCAVRFR